MIDLTTGVLAIAALIGLACILCLALWIQRSQTRETRLAVLEEIAAAAKAVEVRHAPAEHGSDSLG